MKNIIQRVLKTIEGYLIGNKEIKYSKLFEKLEKEYFFYQHNTDGIFTYISPSITKILGYSQEEFSSHYTKYLTLNPINQEAIKYTDLAIKGEQQASYEVEIYHKDGNTCRLEITGVPIFDSDGKIAAVDGVVRDITRRRQMEAELKEKELELLHTSRLSIIGETLAGLAHEINQPLSGIALAAKYLSRKSEKGDLTQEEIRENLEDINYSIRRISDLIKHIRAFVRRDNIVFVEIEINKIINDALIFLKEHLKISEIEIDIELSSELPKLVGEPIQLEQVIINLINNARDAILEKEENILDGKIRVENYKKQLKIITNYDREEKNIEIMIKDNGIGISGYIREKMFEPFFTTKGVGKGTGLGLSISYGIIKNHKGEIRVESEEREGTIIKIILPA